MKIVVWYNITNTIREQDKFLNFFVVFPAPCYKFEGNHSLECLEAVWKYSDCSNTGKLHPARISKNDLNIQAGQNLKWKNQLIDKF